jgi:hypothetical protein
VRLGEKAAIVDIFVADHGKYFKADAMQCHWRIFQMIGASHEIFVALNHVSAI